MPKRKRGRPSKINTINLKQVEKLAGLGLIDTQIADVLGIAESTLKLYKDNPEFSAAIKKGKIKADTEVTKSLYKRALGFEYDEVTYEKNKVGGLAIGIKKGAVNSIKGVGTYKTKVVTKLVVPEVLAQIFWLKNRQPEKWREVKEAMPKELMGEEIELIPSNGEFKEEDKNRISRFINN